MELGAASSIIGIIASAVQSARVLADFAIEVRDAPSDAIAIGQDAQALSSILITLQKWLLTGAVKPAAAASLEGALNTCLQTTNDLCEVIEPYTKTARSRSRLAWRSVKWTLNKQEVRELRERWQQSKSTLTISLAIINTYAIQTGHAELGTQIEAGNDALRQDFRNLQINIAKEKEHKLDAASTIGRRGSRSNATDVNFPLNRYLEELPPEDHPWAQMSEPGDVLSLRSFSIFDTATRSSTPEADIDVTAELRTASPTQEYRAIAREPQTSHDPDSGLRLMKVSSEPTTPSELRSLNATLQDAKLEGSTETNRSKTLPFSALEKKLENNQANQARMSAAATDRPLIGPLHQALIDENTYRIMSLLTTEIDVNELGRDNRTPLHVCALLDDKVTAQALLRTGRVDLSLRDTHHRTPLQCALEVGNDGMACLLLQHGANIEDVSHFIVEMTRRMRKPAEEKVAHTCLAWLSRRDDFKMEHRLINALISGSGSSNGSVARFLEGTPFREPYVQRSGLHIRSRSMESRARGAGMESNASRNRSGVDEFFGMDAPASSSNQYAGSSSLSPNVIIQNSVLWRLNNRA